MSDRGVAEVPRFEQRYSRRKCETAETLRALGWSDELIVRLLGEPDALSVEGTPMFGAERTLLAALSDRELQAQLRPDHYAFTVIEALVPDDDEDHVWDGRYIRLEGFQWLVVCQTAVAEEGRELEVGTRRDGVHRCVARSVRAQWGDFALVKVEKANPRNVLPREE